MGTGGVIVNEEYPEEILRQALVQPSEKGRLLLPDEAELLVDRNYVLFAAGLLQEYDEDAALALMKESLGVV